LPANATAFDAIVIDTFFCNPNEVEKAEDNDSSDNRPK
jgi:hypothetical protein